jgi:glycosyltransferase 2 family protein
VKAVWKKILYGLGICLGGVFFVYQVWQAGKEVLLHSVNVFHPINLTLAWICMLLAYSLQIASWRFIMCGVGVELQWQHVIEGYSLSLLPRYIPGSVWGYLSRSEWLKQEHSTPYSLSTLGSVLEVSLILISVIWVACIFIFFKFSGMVRWSALLLFLLVPFITWSTFYRFTRLKLFRSLFSRLIVDLQVVRFSFPLWVGLLGLYTAAWLFYGESVNQLVKSLGLDPTSGLIEYTFIFTISWTAGFLVLFVPSGLGVRELTFSTLMSTRLFITPGLSSAVSIFSRLGISLVELFWVSFGLILTRINRHE